MFPGNYELIPSPDIFVAVGYNLMKARENFYDREYGPGAHDYLADAIELLPRAARDFVAMTQRRARDANKTAGKVVAHGGFFAMVDGGPIRLLNTAMHGRANWLTNIHADVYRLEMARGCIGEAHNLLSDLLIRFDIIPPTQEQLDELGDGGGR